MPAATRPDAVSGLVLWVTASLGATQVSGHVSTWADQSGLGNNVPLQPSAARRPLYLADAGDGAPGIQFDGIDDGFPPLAGVITSAGPHTIIIQCMSTSVDGAGCVPICIAKNSSSPGYLALYLNPSFDHAATARFVSDAGVEVDPPAVRQLIGENDWMQFMMRTGSPYKLRAGFDTTDVTADFSVGNTANSIVVGSLYFLNDYQGAFNGIIRDIIVYNRAISDLEWEGILAFLLAPHGAAAPVVSSVTPAPGTINAADSIAFDVTDADGDLLDVFVSVTEHVPTLGQTHLVAQGLGFFQPYTSSCAATPITNGIHYFISAPSPCGWGQQDLNIHVVAIDSAGHETTSDLSYLIANPDFTAPAFSTFSPAKGGTIASAGAAHFHVDDLAFASIKSLHVVATFENGTVETVLDTAGAGFGGSYSAGSTATPTGTGYTVSLVRAGGWPDGAISLGLAAVDQNQNVGHDLYELNVSNSAPAIANFSPTTGSSMLRSAPVSFDVTDSNGFSLILVTATYTGGISELVFDGTSFAPGYLGSSKSSITNGFHFLLLRGAGWLPGLVVHVTAIDSRGATSTATDSLTITNPLPSDSAAPVVGNFSPTPGSPVARMDPLFFDVTDDSGDFRRILVAVTYTNGLWALAHDGDNFGPNFLALSERDPITNGWHYRLRRTGGWPDAPTITAYAFDKSGNESA